MFVTFWKNIERVLKEEQERRSGAKFNRLTNGLITIFYYKSFLISSKYWGNVGFWEFH